MARAASQFDSLSFVIAGLVPAIPIRDGQDKPGHDEPRGFASK
jgi:hypothetical protein